VFFALGFTERKRAGASPLPDLEMIKVNAVFLLKGFQRETNRRSSGVSRSGRGLAPALIAEETALV
jgi:hypothetical protein